MRRRTFLQQMGLGTLGLAAQPIVSGRWFHGRQSVEADIVIYGAGASGLCAAVQAARMGAEVVAIEPTTWIGGMLTAAGVSALDGNKHGAGGGLVQTFRQRLADHYGSMDALFTGWISLYGYEPHVGHRILQEWVAPLDTLTILYETEATRYERIGRRARRIRFERTGGETGEVVADVFIDATEYGDGLALAEVPYRLGRESQAELAEPHAPAMADREMQDLTYAATLVKQPGAEPRPVTEQDRAYWADFQCSTQLDCPNPDPELLNHTIHTWERFITYAALPNDKVLLNWPHHANDFPVNVAFFEDRYYRRKHLQAAKLHTLQFVSYMQHALGHPEWQLATDEYPTADHLPLIPYLRESRRMVNDRIMVQDDVIPRGDHPRAPTIRNSVAVGDYFIDHHHAKAHLPPDRRLDEDYPDNAPFQVPASVFFPANGDESFLAGEKSIAVSHIVNGCTRLQPVVMLMGQALGVIAARATQQNRAPRDVDIDAVQQTLVGAGCPLYIMYDVPAGDPLFEPVQQLARQSVLQADDPTELQPDEPIPVMWAHRWVHRAKLPADTIQQESGPLRAQNVDGSLRDELPDSGTVTRGDFVQALHQHLSTS